MSNPNNPEGVQRFIQRVHVTRRFLVVNFLLAFVFATSLGVVHLVLGVFPFGWVLIFFASATTLLGVFAVIALISKRSLIAGPRLSLQFMGASMKSLGGSRPTSVRGEHALAVPPPVGGP